MNTTKENIKTVLICVLIIGMVYLTYSVWFFDSPFGEFHLSELISIVPEDTVAESEKGADLEQFGIRPLGMMLRREGASSGTVYNDTECARIYSSLRDTLADVFATAGDAVTVNAAEWDKALVGNGVYLDYGGNIPLDALRMWLGGKDGAAQICARGYVFSTEEKRVRIYAKNSEQNTVYMLESNIASEKIDRCLSGITAGTASFAAEKSEPDFAALRPEMIVTDVTESPYIITAYNSFASFNAEVKNACLESFGLLGTTPSTYSEQDGTEVYVADMITLKFSQSGIVSYSDPRDETDETLGLSVNIDGEAPTLAEATEAARSLAAAVASKLPTGGGIYLISATRTGGETEIVFGRHIGGIPIDMNETAYFARVVIRGSSIRAAKINLRGYDTTAQNADILSERLAAAAVSGNDRAGELNLRYADRGEASIVPAWFIGGVRKKTAEEAK